MGQYAPILHATWLGSIKQSMYCEERQRGTRSVILVATLTLLDLVGGALGFLVDSHHSLGTAGLGQPVNSPSNYNIRIIATGNIGSSAWKYF